MTITKKIIADCNQLIEIPKELTWNGFLQESFREKELVNFQRHFGMECHVLKGNERIPKNVSYDAKTDILTKSFECRDIIAYDTETYQGSCKLLCDSKKNHVLNGSFDEYLLLLTKYRDKSSIHRFFFNIDFDVSAIFKVLIQEITKLSLSWSFKYRVRWRTNLLKWMLELSRGVKKRYQNYEFKWISNSFLSIHIISRKRNIMYTDINKFFKISLNEVAKIYLDNSEKDNIDGQLLNSSLSYWNENEKDIINYCIKDCVLTENAGWILIEAINKLNLPLPRALVSPASISKTFFRFNNRMNNLENIPIKALQAGFNTYAGGRFEVFNIGYFDELYLHDINSQYPEALEKLPDLENGCWSFENNGKLPDKETFGFYYVEVDIPANYKYIPTIPIRHLNIIKFPVGKFKQWVTWYDLDLIREFIIKIHDVIEYIPNESCRYPFRDGINLLYQKKKEIKPFQDTMKMEYRLCKIVMNGVYGCTIEIHDEYNQDNAKAGILFNPIYASWICGFGRWSVLKAIPKEKHSIIRAIHTDSLITNENIDEYIEIGQNLGQWNLEVKGYGWILGTGQYQIKDLVKTRGISKKNVNTWKEFLEKNHDKKKVKIITKRMRKIREAIIQDESVLLVNTKIPYERIITPLSDSKRIWQNGIETFNDLLYYNWKSKPLYYDYTSKKLTINDDAVIELNKKLLDSFT